LQRGQRAGCTAELQHQGIVGKSLQATLAALQGIQPTRRLQPERHRHCLLQQRTPGQTGTALGLGQPRQRGAQDLQARPHVADGRAQLQHRAGIDDVLAGGAPVHPARGFGVARRDLRGERLHQGNGRVAGQGRRCRQRRQRVQVRAAGCFDRGERRSGNHPALHLRTGQRAFNIQHRLQARLVGERSVDGGVAEQTAQQRWGVTHRCSPSWVATAYPRPPNAGVEWPEGASRAP